jgi:DNA-binding YbaB/EbfC family protein
MAKGGMGNIMKQAQMMQANLQKAQAELANIDVEGSAGNGMIKITISCKHEIKKIDIDPSLLEDKEMLEDLIMVAVKDALGKVESTSSQKMGGLVPPGMNLPF